MGVKQRGELSAIREAATGVDLRRDGQPLLYRAVVVERVMAPAAELDPLILDCAGRTHWRALFWREGARPEGVVLHGGWFHQRLVPQLERCPDIDNLWYFRPEPSVSAFLPDSATNLTRWVSTDGEADVSPGVVIGDCTFLTADAVRIFREQLGLTCEVTRHRVWLQARVRPSVSAQAESHLELPPTEIIGIRYTLHSSLRRRAAREGGGVREVSPPTLNGVG